MMREFILFLKFAVLCTILLVVLLVIPAPAFAQACAPTTPGLRSATAGFPDGANARRAEAGLRFVF
jgi:hypothetical protein